MFIFLAPVAVLSRSYRGPSHGGNCLGVTLRTCSATRKLRTSHLPRYAYLDVRSRPILQSLIPSKQTAAHLQGEPYLSIYSPGGLTGYSIDLRQPPMVRLYTCALLCCLPLCPCSRKSAQNARTIHLQSRHCVWLRCPINNPRK